MNQENLSDNQLENTLESPAETKSENSLLGALSKCLTFAPLMLEQFTGQKVPQMTGTMAEIQNAINQIRINMNLLGLDLKPLTTEITKFSQGQQQIITLLKENNQLQKQILSQLGGKLTGTPPEVLPY
ncbi:11667_t:CDS:2 [Funneliformis geosporum]|uniref:1395_t:CDS:1 n=1 Tax=Funneliformis geosporum TaxID=1117311 RepID=A0A9W4WS06_9GLOM|nr:11667_t:CDS:2 [Funneliformis geosporum]CAI2182404.1 1395_t:CDS:2 [Funneliformis geosporum]